MAPDDRQVIGDDAADIERGPVARRHVLPIELPQPKPMVATPVGVTVEIEEQRLGRLAPDRLELLPIETRIRVDIIGVQFQDLFAVALGTADEIGIGHGLSRWNSKLAIT
jgi:hypothetical protein